MGNLLSAEEAKPTFKEVSRLYREATSTNEGAKEIGHIGYSVEYVDWEQYKAMKKYRHLVEVRLSNLPPENIADTVAVFKNLIAVGQNHMNLFRPENNSAVLPVTEGSATLEGAITGEQSFAYGCREFFNGMLKINKKYKNDIVFQGSGLRDDKGELFFTLDPASDHSQALVKEEMADPDFQIVDQSYDDFQAYDQPGSSKQAPGSSH
ncbi:unnamed protein product [Caenorhabditis auriculariae]|uniref:Uncharacterized protein n=1 Tax=Caenorhabditis auriculariae TaxID=2777116 RepID=A0A8S1H850_9PELO|nr:unnamed protein product [Caenorhabditis auriculariae]